MIYKNQHFVTSYFNVDLNFTLRRFDLAVIVEKVNHYEFLLL